MRHFLIPMSFLNTQIEAYGYREPWSGWRRETHREGEGKSGRKRGRSERD